MDRIFVGNDNYFKIDALTDAQTNALIDGATLTWELRDAVLALTASGAMTAEGSGGLYHGNIEEDVALVENDLYWLEVFMDAGSDRIGVVKKRLKAKERSI